MPTQEAKVLGHVGIEPKESELARMPGKARARMAMGAKGEDVVGAIVSPRTPRLYVVGFGACKIIWPTAAGNAGKLSYFL